MRIVNVRSVAITLDIEDAPPTTGVTSGLKEVTINDPSRAEVSIDPDGRVRVNLIGHKQLKNRVSDGLAEVTVGINSPPFSEAPEWVELLVEDLLGRQIGELLQG